VIYLDAEGHKILILEPGNLRHLQHGGSVVAPDRSVMVLYTPDVEWLGQQFKSSMASDRLDVDTMLTLHKESQSRKPVTDPPPRPTELIGTMGRPRFECPRCHAVSFNPNDVELGYCGRCHEFTGAVS
jgi:ribosomal protein S27AE